MALTHTRLRREAAAHELLLDGIARCNLQQSNLIKNHNGRILDWVLVSEDKLLTPVEKSNDTLVAIDKHHPALEFELLNLPRVEFTSERDDRSLNFKKTNFFALRRELELTNWSPVLECQ